MRLCDLFFTVHSLELLTLKTFLQQETKKSGAGGLPGGRRRARGDGVAKKQNKIPSTQLTIKDRRALESQGGKGAQGASILKELLKLAIRLQICCNLRIGRIGRLLESPGIFWTRKRRMFESHTQGSRPRKPISLLVRWYMQMRPYSFIMYSPFPSTRCK